MAEKDDVIFESSFAYEFFEGFFLRAFSCYGEADVFCFFCGELCENFLDCSE